MYVRGWLCQDRKQEYKYVPALPSASGYAVGAAAQRAARVRVKKVRRVDFIMIMEYTFGKDVLGYWRWTRGRCYALQRENVE